MAPSPASYLPLYLQGPLQEQAPKHEDPTEKDVAVQKARQDRTQEPSLQEQAPTQNRPTVLEVAIKLVRRDVNRYMRTHNATSVAKSSKVPKFWYEELAIGRLLGSGGFSNVYEIDTIALDPACDKAFCGTSQKFSRKAVGGMASKKRGRNAGPLVVKMLQESRMSELGSSHRPARDLIVEAHLLSALSHPHLIGIRGVSWGGAYCLNHRGFFIILDRIEHTLWDKFAEWKRIMKLFHRDPESRACLIRITKSCSYEQALYGGRLQVIRDISSALAYLHDCQLIYRDVKPANIGFASNGMVKLFDLGLCKQPNSDGYCIYPCGTTRYMAPEVYQCYKNPKIVMGAKQETKSKMKHRYTFNADVYSLGITLYETLTLKRALSTEDAIFCNSISKSGARPYLRIPLDWPTGVASLLHDALEPVYANRISMSTFHGKIQREIDILGRGSSEHARPIVHRDKTMWEV